MLRSQQITSMFRITQPFKMTDIDDLSDSEQYNDEDFVVGTPSPNKHSAEGNTNDVDDEQHAQKVNGQIEQLKMTVRDLEEQLETGTSCVYKYMYVKIYSPRR